MKLTKEEQELIAWIDHSIQFSSEILEEYIVQGMPPQAVCMLGIALSYRALMSNSDCGKKPRTERIRYLAEGMDLIAQRIEEKG